MVYWGTAATTAYRENNRECHRQKSSLFVSRRGGRYRDRIWAHRGGDGPCSDDDHVQFFCSRCRGVRYDSRFVRPGCRPLKISSDRQELFPPLRPQYIARHIRERRKRPRNGLSGRSDCLIAAAMSAAHWLGHDFIDDP